MNKDVVITELARAPDLIKQERTDLLKIEEKESALKRALAELDLTLMAKIMEKKGEDDKPFYKNDTMRKSQLITERLTHDGYKKVLKDHKNITHEIAIRKIELQFLLDKFSSAKHISNLMSVDLRD